MKVNLGCGEFRAEGWVNVDVQSEDGPLPDVVASAYDMPFDDNSVTHLYAGHFLEHIAFEDLPLILKEIARILTPDGEVMFVGPDLTRAEENWPEMVAPILNGEGRWPGDEHLWESREETIMDLLKEEGWEATAIAIADVDSKWPVTSYIGWQYAISALPKQIGVE